LRAVQNEGYGAWDITVAIREEMTEKDGPLAAHRPLLEGLKQHDNPWSEPKSQRGSWADGLGLRKLGDVSASTLLFAGCSADQAAVAPGVIALAKLMQRAGEDFATLSWERKGCAKMSPSWLAKRNAVDCTLTISAFAGSTSAWKMKIVLP